MTANTITIERIKSLLAAIEAAGSTTFRVLQQAEAGEIDPEEAASILNETVAHIARFNQ
jgi:hypothetical protein